MSDILFNNANSRETYFTLHNIKSAHAVALGKGVKVGVIDWLFSNAENSSLYVGYADISGKPECLNQSGHGFWMANTLRKSRRSAKYTLLTPSSTEIMQTVSDFWKTLSSGL